MDLGLEEYLHGGGVCAIEWADKALGALSRSGMLVEIDQANGQERLITCRPLDRHHEGLTLALKAAIDSGAPSLIPRNR